MTHMSPKLIVQEFDSRCSDVYVMRVDPAKTPIYHLRAQVFDTEDGVPRVVSFGCGHPRINGLAARLSLLLKSGFRVPNSLLEWVRGERANVVGAGMDPGPEDLRSLEAREFVRRYVPIDSIAAQMGMPFTPTKPPSQQPPSPTSGQTHAQAGQATTGGLAPFSQKAAGAPLEAQGRAVSAKPAGYSTYFVLVSASGGDVPGMWSALARYDCVPSAEDLAPITAGLEAQGYSQAVLVSVVGLL